MKRFPCAVAVALAFGVSIQAAFATPRSFRDITAESPSKRYRVEAKSPDNEDGGRSIPSFQASFVYTCHDKTTGKLLWTRKQAMGKPESVGNGSAMTFRSPLEASPIAIFVSDTGWTVIRTGWDELIVVDLAGKDRSRVDLLSKALTKEEQAKYVHQTTAGPMWEGFSLWYFLDAEGQALFVVRPWWGRRVVLNLETGKVIQPTAPIAVAASTYERTYVLTELRKAVDNRSQWGKEDVASESLGAVFEVAYVAGRMQLNEAIPFLEKLQESSYIGSGTSGGMGMLERFDGEVNPHEYSTFNLRSVVHLSLRRLGKVPRPLPLNQFDVQYEDRKKNRPYTPKPLSVARESNADKVKKGMKVEQVLDLVGSPDFVGYDSWEYDMDASPPFSLVLTWDVRHVTDVHKTTPALWKEGFVRDEQMIR